MKRGVLRTHRFWAKCLFIELGGSHSGGGSYPGGQPRALLWLARCKMPSEHIQVELLSSWLARVFWGSEDRFLPQVRLR